MQRYHDTRQDPLPIRSPNLDLERERLAQLTEAFLANGGTVEQVGHQMKTSPYEFVINPMRTPVYAHLFAQPEAEALRAEPLPQPIAAPTEPEVEPVIEKARRPGQATAAQLAARLMAQAALGASPAAAAHLVGISVKHARQLASDYRITFKRQH